MKTYEFLLDNADTYESDFAYEIVDSYTDWIPMP